MPEPFTGFPAESIEFFEQLAAHNDRDWFLAHKDVYERACRAPMLALVAQLEPRLGPAKVSRINRDTRFSRNRAPYKTYVAAGVGGHYVSLSADGLFVGGGLYRPDPARLQRLRAAIDDDTTGRRIQAIVAVLRRRGYEVGSHDSLSSAPRGYSLDHPRLELLQMKDIFAGRRFAPARWLSTAGARQRIERVIDDTRPLVAWLQQHVSGADRETPAKKGHRAERRKGPTSRSPAGQ